MALELRQQLKLSQQLVMTPQLQQAIRLLQLSRVDLLETVQQELMENPFLEESAPQPEAPAPSEQEDRPSDIREDAAYDGELARNADWEDYLGEFASTPKGSQSQEFDVGDDMTPFEGRYAEKPSLDGHLRWQLRLSSLTERQQEIGEAIIGNLSSVGYLQASVDELAAMTQATPDEVRAVLERVQQFDPVGVAARDASECLMVQIRNLGYERDPVLVSLVTEHLEDLEAKRYKPLLRKFKIDMADLQEYLELIQTLDPFPGASFGNSEPTYVSPDVYVYKSGKDFVIMLNDEGLPHLQLSELNDLPLSGSDKEMEYCAEKKRAASWLIKSLYQRQKTLYKVVESIVRHQRPFFEEGVTKLGPLILKEIAEDIGMHESTVSRITTNKFVATPHGIFELKFFFNSGLTVDDGSAVGSESVKALIKKFISEEDPKAPLSDEKLGEMLKEHLKVTIARRTVAKYRMALNIASSSKRKAHF